VFYNIRKPTSSVHIVLVWHYKYVILAVIILLAVNTANMK